MGDPIVLLAILIGILSVAAVMWWFRRQRSGGKIVSLVYLLRRPRELSETEVQAAVRRAFGHESLIPVTATDRPNFYIIQTPQATLGLMSVDSIYVNDVAAAADQIRDFRCKRAMQEHQAWLAVDLLGAPPPGGEEAAFQFIGKLIAEFAATDCLALLCPKTGQINSFDSDLLELLRSQNPLAALSHPQSVPVMHVNQDDAEMSAAVAEARKRWPEFVSAFHARRPLQGFAVKMPFQVKEIVEYMWVEVSQIDGETIHGKLVSEPREISNLQINDLVQVSLIDLNDWVYSDGKQMVGGFTTKVLESRQ